MNHKPVFHILGWLLTISLILAPGFWTLTLAALFAIRILALRQPKFWRHYILVQIAAGLSVLAFQTFNETQLTREQHAFQIEAAGSDIKIDGDLLSITGRVRLEKAPAEKVQIYYWLADEQEQHFWLRQNQAVVLNVAGNLDEADVNGNRGLFNFRDYLRQQQIYWVLTATKIDVIQPAMSWRYRASNLSQQISQWVMRLNHDVVVNYILSLFFNDLAALNQDTLRVYQQLGLIHLFSISGFHATYLVGVLRYFCLRAGMLVEHFDWVALVVLLAYAAILGWPYGMLRVVISYLYNWLQHRRGQPGSTLVGTGWSMWLIMLANPYSIFSLSFQLTFALSFTVILLGPAIQERFPNEFSRELLLSLVCTQMTLPFLISHYYTFSWAALIFNYFYSVFFALVMFPGLLFILSLHGLRLANQFFFIQELMATAIQALEKMSFWLNEWQPLKWVVGITPAILISLLGFAIIVFYIQLQSGTPLKRKIWAFLAVLLFLYIHPYLNPDGRVIALDVGQGDCLLIELPHQQGSYLIDVAGRPQFAKEGWAERHPTSLADREIIPSLQAEGIRHLDGIFITHGDFDHIGSFAEIVAAYSVAHLYLPVGMQNDAAGLRELADGLANSLNPGIQIHWLTAGDSVPLKQPYHLTVLAPNAVGEGANEDSLVLHGKFGPKAFLFTGDIVGEAEQQLAENLKHSQLQVDILKVAHHGSDYSTPASFLRLIEPEQAWISVGEGNRYGHPGPRLMADLAAQEIEMYQTDKDGAIHYIFNQNSFTINTVKKH